jgi:hypothetical protein
MAAIQATVDQLATAFTEWENERREKPAEFWSEAKRRKETPQTYGEACAEHLAALLAKRPTASE